ncbi:prolipoprotein diacylglyceryl transferase [Aedoeadaptatus nemausensis]|uniref:Phosphatidylglycerol--prolipoprotein diacylglyceryl transferase n=1 Tax=Aedoeadaptatus nemausensis TaxID=2582829 RepID=A0A6V6XZP0_9FIRM|nr:prolipoprotein diacylglyceryl transferase [Peptoniphilus nemausensis]CAC9924557.1 prolipoprotein diacylglyceryl transferase [Peptoniphilus nemausensis]
MNPIAFTLFGIEVRWYGIFIAIGAMLAIYFGEKLIERNPRIPKESIVDMSLLALPLGIVGARLYYVLFEWEYYSQHTSEIFAIRNGGLAIHGGLLVGAFVIFLFSKTKKVQFLDLLDMIVGGVALAQGIGRWGNFMNGEAHGGPTDLPWAIPVDGVMVHPTFLYESILDIGIFLFIYFYLSKRRKYPGELSGAYLILYSIGRFFIEGLRTDSLYIGPLKTAQVMSLIGIAIGISLLINVYRHKNTDDYRLINKNT